MKKALCLCMILCTLLSLCACAKKNNDPFGGNSELQEAASKLQETIQSETASSKPASSAPEKKDWYEIEISDDLTTMYVHGEGAAYVNWKEYENYVEFIEKIIYDEGITKITSFYPWYDMNLEHNHDVEIVFPSTLKTLDGKVGGENCDSDSEPFYFPNHLLKLTFAENTQLDSVYFILSFFDGATNGDMPSYEEFLSAASLDTLLSAKELYIDLTHDYGAKYQGDASSNPASLTIPEGVGNLIVEWHDMNNYPRELYLPNTLEKIEFAYFRNNENVQVYYPGSLKDWLAIGGKNSENIHYDYKAE